MNMLGWALLCPYARDIIWHGSVPLYLPKYPTGEEAKPIHENMKKIILEDIPYIIEHVNLELLNYEQEYTHSLCISRNEETVCANSKADIVLYVASRRSIYTLYIEITSRIHVVKPWQALLRGIGLYYEKRLPVWIIIASPEEIRYKILTEQDQQKVLKTINRSSENYKPAPNLCSLCELSQYCPYRAV